MEQKWLEQLPLTDIKRTISVPGGDVNEAYRIETATETYFLLVQPKHPESFYTAEIAGLNEFKKATVRSPEVIASGEIDGDAYLILEFLKEGIGNQNDLGKLIAKMHQYHSTNHLFGFHEDYHGKDVSFKHEWTDSWLEMFVENKLDHMKNMLVEKNLWSDEELERYKQARAVIVHELEAHQSKPSLLHGDLWSGNYMFLENGQPALFDPAALYGDCEFDIGVSLVFGGFSQEFYDAYQAEYPLAEGYEKRLNFYRLYMLMLHLVKFGNSYADSVNQTLNDIIESAE